MSLWTPDGEVPVERDKSSESAESPELSPEEQEQAREMAKAMAESREQILGTEVSALLANHAMGLYELAAIHLTADECNFDETRLAIDALKIFVDGLEGRLGPAEQTLKEALHQIQMGYVQRFNDSKQVAAEEDPSSSP